MPVINTNVKALVASNAMNINSRNMAQTMQSLSTGSRINSAADDAAGLGVADSLRADHHSADQAARNVNDGISMIGVAEGATNEISNILTRLRELAVQSSSETLANTERAYINDESTALLAEIDRIAAVTEFNGVLLSDGSTTAMDVQVGINNSVNDRITITLGDLRASNIGVSSIDLSTATGAQNAIAMIDAGISSVSSFRSDFGAIENRLGSALNNIETYSEATKGAESAIRDADFGIETAVLTQNQILQQAGVSILAQAKNLNSSALTLLQ